MEHLRTQKVLANFLFVRVQINTNYLGRSTHFCTLCYLKMKV
jgi:hypothetical protein